MRPAQKALCRAATLAMLAGVPAHAGVRDTPLPTFADGKLAVLVYTAFGVIKDSNLGTAFICTNVDAVPADIGVEVFDETGALRNAIAAGDGAILNVPPGATVTVGTDAMAVLRHDQVVTLNAAGTGANDLRNGSGRVVATSGQVGCVALAVDRLHTIQDPAVCPTCQPPSLATLALSASPATTPPTTSTTQSPTTTTTASSSTTTISATSTTTTRRPTTTTSTTSTTTTRATTTINSTTSSSTTSTSTTSSTTTTLLTTLPPSACPDAPAAAAVQAEIDVRCDCRGSRSHGAYVSCAMQVAKAALKAGRLTKRCNGTVKSCAARSTCGRPGFVTCCRTSAKGATKCSIKRSAALCKPRKGGTACVSVHPSCCGACSATGCQP